MKRMRLLLTSGVLACALSSVSVAQDTEVPQGISIAVEGASVDTTVNASVVQPQPSADDQPVVEDTQKGGNEARKKSVVVEIHSSSESRSDDGDKPRVKVSGRIVVIGPDGEKTEYDLNDKEAQAFKVQIQEGSDVAEDLDRIIIMNKKALGKYVSEEDREQSSTATSEEERFVIGIQCEEAGELLRVHLRLGEKGVVILDVHDETPAAEGGLQKSDIIVSIDSRDVVSRDDLIKAVLESDGKPLALSIIRAGEPQAITVTPTKMKVPIVLAPATTDVEQLKELTGSTKGGIRLQLIHPGIMLDGVLPHDHEAINKMIEQLRKSAGKEAARALELGLDAGEAGDQSQRSAEQGDEQLRESLRALQQEMRDLHQQLADLKKQLKSQDAEQ